MYKNASDDMEPCESLLMCERSNLSMKLDRVLHELRTDNEALRSQLTENEKARKTEYEALKILVRTAIDLFGTGSPEQIYCGSHQ